MADNLWLFYGAEDFLIEEKVREIAGRFSEVARFEEEALTAEKLVALLGGGSLFGGQKLLIFRLTDLTDPLWDGLIPYLAGNRVIFWADKLGRGESKLRQYLKREAEGQEFKTFTDWEQEALASWLIRRVEQAGKKLPPPAAQLLLSITGNNLRALVTEINKLITYIGERAAISEDDVLALASPGQLSVFALTDAIIDKNGARALAAWQNLRRNRFDLAPFLSLLVTNFRVLAALKSVPDINRVSRELNTGLYFVKKLLNKTSRFSQEELANDLKLILETNLKIRNGEAEVPAVELLVASLCAAKNG